jgi:cell division septum initiation protein DivIVA
MKLTETTPEVSFRTRLLGFDRQEVRAFISNILEDYEKVRRDLGRLEQQTATRDTVADPLGPDAMMKDLQRILGGAHKVADEIEARATEESSRAITEANARAADIIAAAERLALEMTGQARRDLVSLEQRASSLRAQCVKLRAAFESVSDTAAVALSEMAAIESHMELPEITT